MGRLAAKHMTAIDEYGGTEKIMAIQKKTTSGGAITVKTTAPGDVKSQSSGKLRFQVRWLGLRGKVLGKSAWQGASLSDGVKIVYVAGGEVTPTAD